MEVEVYTSISPKILSKAKRAPYKYSDADLTVAKASCEDRLFEAEYAGLQFEVMKWQVQRWLWNTLFPNETDRFPGTKPRQLPADKTEDAPKGLTVKIRKTPNGKEDNKSKGEETVTRIGREALSLEISRPCARCRSRSHEENDCTSQVLHERVLECSVPGHDIYIFGKMDGCPNCFQSL